MKAPVNFSPYTTYKITQPDEYTWLVCESVTGTVVGMYHDPDVAERVRKAKETEARDNFMRGWGGARPAAKN